MSIGLTMRQRAFLNQIVEIYAGAHEPLHYSRVADALSVSRATAYDMLRVLERKGMVRSQYVVPERPPGPGRANIVFVPTQAAQELRDRLIGDVARDKEWEEVKAKVLATLHRHIASDDRDLLRDVLARLPQTRSPMAYAAQVITALLLTLQEAKYKLGPRSPLGILLENTSGKSGVSMLAGLAFGLSAMARVQERLWHNLPDHVRRYEAAVQELSAERVNALRDFTNEVVAALRGEAG